VSADRASAQNGSRIVLSGNVVLRAGEGTLRASNVELLLHQGGGQVASVFPVTPENPIPRRTRGVTPARPAQFSSVRVVVTSRVTLDRNGAVTAVVPDGCGVADPRDSEHLVCNAFNAAVSAAIRQWRYDRPAQGPIQFYVTITFRPGAEPTVTQSGEGNSAGLRETQDGLRRLAETDRDNADYQRAAASFQADLARMSDMFRELERAQRLGERGLLAQSSLQDAMARSRAELARVEAQLKNIRLTGDDRARAERQYQAALEQYRAAERQYQADLEEQGRAVEPLRQTETRLRASQGQLEQTNPITDERIRALEERLREAQRVLEASRAQVSASVDGSQQLRSPSGRTPIRVSDVPGLKAPTVRKSVKPEHPLAAMKARVEGTVVVEALVDEQGRVADVRVTKSIPLLDQAAMDAARQWEFTPTLMNGEPVPVLLQLEMDFRMR
jgi:protein TonB